MKLLVAGPDTVHVGNYCKSIRPYVDRLVLLTEQTYVLEGIDAYAVFSFRKFNLLAWLKNFRAIQAYLRKENPTLIHIHQINRLAFIIAFIANRLSIPIVTTAWGSDVLLIPQQNWIYKKMVQFVLKKSKVVTADAKIMIDAMQKLVKKSTEEYIFLQYGIDAVIPAKKEKIIYSNRLHSELYNIAGVITAFAVFHAKHPDWNLVIGGSGPLTAALKAQVDQLGLSASVKFIGFVNQETNHAYYAKAAIYISIPFSDGTSVSLLEAMSANCIPVVSNLPVSHEWISNGLNGIIMDSTNNPFEQALQLDAEQCYQLNQDKIATHALKSTTVKLFSQLYQKAING